tara:strand:- start:49 stop:699 length:651 start_codon:yes stop_codon:yes gene_type:complete
MLGSSIDKPLTQNPLAGGPGLIIPNPNVTTPRGGGQFEGYDFMKGFKDSEFFKKANQMQQDAVNFKFDGKDMMMNSSMAGALQQYLNSIGKGDLFQRDDVLSGPLAQIGGGIPSPPGFDLKQADPNNLLTGVTPPIGGGTLNGVSLFPFPGMNNTEIASASDQRGLPSILGINPMGQQSSFEQTFNDKQGLDRYVDDLVNERLRDIFGGIMGAINV